MIENIKIYNLNKKYGQRYIFKNVNLKFNRGKINILEGKNGTGKTTLLNIIGGIDSDFEGEIIFDDTTFNTQNCILYIQNNNLFNYMNVIDNLKLVCNDEIKIDKLLKKVSLESYKTKNVSSLSKGEKQRIALLKILLSNKEVVLLDEPFSNLDKNNAFLFMTLFKEYAKDKIVILANNKSLEELKEDALIYSLPFETSDKISEYTVKQKKIEKQNICFFNKKLIKKTLFHFVKKNILYLIFSNLLIILLIIVLNISATFLHDYKKDVLNAISENNIKTFISDEDLNENKYRTFNAEFLYKEKAISYKYCLSNNNQFLISDKLIKLSDFEVVLPIKLKEDFNLTNNETIEILGIEYSIKDFYDEESNKANLYYETYYGKDVSFDIYAANYPILCSNTYFIDNAKNKSLYCEIEQLGNLFEILNNYYHNKFKRLSISYSKDYDLKDNNVVLAINKVFIENNNYPIQVKNTTFTYSKINGNGIALNDFYKTYKINEICSLNNIDLDEIHLYISESLSNSILENVINYGIGTNNYYFYFTKDIINLDFIKLSSISFNGDILLSQEHIAWYYKNKSFFISFIFIFLFVEILGIALIFSFIKRKFEAIIITMYINKINFKSRFIIFLLIMLFSFLVSYILSFAILLYINNVNLNNPFLFFLNDFNFNLYLVIISMLLSLLEIVLFSLYLSYVSLKSLQNAIRLDSKNM